MLYASPSLEQLLGRSLDTVIGQNWLTWVAPDDLGHGKRREFLHQQFGTWSRLAVRVEEFVNYFKQPYTVSGDEAFGVFAEAAPSPFNSVPSPLEGEGRRERSERGVRGDAAATPSASLQLLKIGIKSRDPKPDERKPAMLTFAIDTSGSMTRDARAQRPGRCGRTRIVPACREGGAGKR